MAEPTYGAPTPESPGSISSPEQITPDAASEIQAPPSLSALPPQGLRPLEEV